MEIAILSRGRSLYSTRRLVEAAEDRGHEPEVIDYLRCIIDISSQKPTVRFMGRKLEEFEAVIPRIGTGQTFYGTAVVRQFEMMRVYVANRSQAITSSRDKLRSLQLLTRKGVDMPVTGFAHSTKDIAGLLELVGGTPVVIKLLESTQGVGVILAESRKAAEAVIEAFRQLEANILVQEYISEADATDIRCLVVGDRVVAAMKRVGEPGEYRSNLHRGGRAEAIELTSEIERVALEATRAVGLNIAGVDLLPSKRGPLVMEVNSSPGLEGVEEATGIDVAGEMIDFIEQQVEVRPVPES
jgi:ribosomal protein S6--L-glutamate ligase